MPGDIVFSFADGQIGAWGVVTAEACTSPKPTEFGSAGHYWDNEGWLLDVAFQAAPLPISTVAYKDQIAPLLPSVYSPIRANGYGNQGAYLAAISDDLGVMLLGMIGAANSIHDLLPIETGATIPALEDIDAIDASPDISITEKRQLIASRVGQGLFRKRALLQGAVCRVTGVSEKRFLRASHIKPWRDSNNFERLDGSNGLMLSPHIDVLFDQDLLTFSNSGEILVSKNLDQEVLSRWSISKPAIQVEFTPLQAVYLEAHRERTGGSGLVSL